MKYEEALKIINQNLVVAIHDSDGDNPKCEQEQISALKLAVEALEKQIPKKGIMIGDNYSSILSCPNCRKPIVNVWNIAKYEPNYCHYCGQALDWSEIDDE